MERLDREGREMDAEGAKGGGEVEVVSGSGAQPDPVPGGQGEDEARVAEGGSVAGGAEGGGEAAGGEAGDVSQGEDAAGEPSEAEVLRSELEAARKQAVASHRRALLAENAGKVVVELVAGDSVEALDASVVVARVAYESVRAATLAEMAAGTRVGAGNGTRGNPVDVESMSPMSKIAYGLKPARE